MAAVQLGRKMGAKVIATGTSVEKLKTIMDFQFNHFKENPSIITIIFSESSFQYFVAEVIRKMIKKRNQKLIQIWVLGA